MRVTDVGAVDLLDPDLYAHGDPHAVWRSLRTNDPVHWHPEADGPGFWAITRYDDVLAVSKDPELFCSGQGVEIVDAPELDSFRGTMLIMTDPPRHTKLRSLVSKVFTPRMVAGLEDFMRSTFSLLLDAIRPGQTYDLVTEIAGPLPLTVISEMMGFPAADRQKVGELMYRFLGYTEAGDDEAMRLGAAAELWSYFHELQAERRRAPSDDLTSALVAAEVDGERLTDVELDAFFLLLVGAGIETTRTAFSGGMLTFIEHPDQWKRLRADRSLVPTAIREVLRYVTPVTSFRRTATRDTELRGRRISEGQKVVVWYASANRDEEVFADPDRFDVERDPNEHLAFGFGTHFCLGSSLARRELRAMLEATLDRYDEPPALVGEVERKENPSLWGPKRAGVCFS
jgi:cytochrome P450